MADEADTAGLAERVVAAAELVEAIREETKAEGNKLKPVAVATLTGDKGYYCVTELAAIQESGIKTVISDPVRNRRVDKLEPVPQGVVRRARCAVKSGYGKALLRRRGMHLERSFAHLLDSGGMRRATLRGKANLDQRYKIAAATYNLSQLLRHLFGIGTPKQAAAGILEALLKLLLACLRVPARFAHFPLRLPHLFADHQFRFCVLPFRIHAVQKRLISTGF